MSECIQYLTKKQIELDEKRVGLAKELEITSNINDRNSKILELCRYDILINFLEEMLQENNN